jgi:hypothetical protein
MLSGLILWEDQDKHNAMADEFEATIFAHSVVGHIPGLYHQLYKRRFGDFDEEDIEWRTPHTQEDFEELRKMMADAGVSY